MPLRMGEDMPSFDGATEWINGSVTSSQLVGKPSIVHFWAVSCYICKNNMPTLREWHERYGDELNFVGIHRPRQESDMDLASVRATMEQFGVTEPTAIDNTHEVGDRFGTGAYWPYYFLFDAEGKMRSRAAGDVGLAQIGQALERLMKAEAA